MRCFGVDDDIYKINFYGNNYEHKLEDRYKIETIKKKYLNFNRADNHGANVYNFSSSLQDSVSFISGSPESQNIANTYEFDAIFPKKPGFGDVNFENYQDITSSLFGVVSVANPNMPNNLSQSMMSSCDFSVLAVRTEAYSENVQFVLTSSVSSYGCDISLVSPIFKNVYNDQRWNFGVRIKPDHIDRMTSISGANSPSYQIEFYGVSVINEEKVEEFALSSSLCQLRGEALLTEPRRLYVGAKRNDLNGNIVYRSDVYASSARLWLSDLSNDTIYKNAIQVNVAGAEMPYKSAYLEELVSFDPTNAPRIPQIDTLALSWDFSQVTSSDINNQFEFSEKMQILPSKYGALGDIAKQNHSYRGDFFFDNQNVSRKEHIAGLQKRLPEQISSDDTVQILNEDDLQFTKESRPITTSISIERSMYQTISEEMLKIMSSINEFSNFIGEPVNRYRHEYKKLNKLRSLFFETIGNTPDLEKYVEYYKWLDLSLESVIAELFPASADIEQGVNNMVESHAFERNKIKSQFPLTSFKKIEPEVGIKGINDLTFSWKYGHAPVGLNEKDNAIWWEEKAEKNKFPISSSNAAVNTSKELIFDCVTSALTRKQSNPLRLSTEAVLDTGILSSPSKNLDFIRTNHHEKFTFGLTGPNSQAFVGKDTNDESDLHSNFKADELFGMTGNSGSSYQAKIALPGDITLNQRGFVSGTLELEDGHLDFVGQNHEIAMQGTFTERFVGGNFYRHQALFSSGSSRAEAYLRSGTMFANPFLVDVNQARSDFFREEVAKRPVSIKNIKDANFSKNYEVIQTCDREINNQWFNTTGNLLLTKTETYNPFLNQNNPQPDYQIFDRGRNESVFVVRFSAPGGRDVLGNGGLDIVSEEKSVYNALPFRNLSVRKPYNDLLFLPCEFGGLQSGSATSGSVHKIQRNTFSSITGKIYEDNGFIQHPIPQSDLGIAWIAASLDKTGPTPTSDFNRPIEYTTIQSLLDMPNTPQSDFAGINKYVYEPTDYGNLGFDLASSIINYRNPAFPFLNDADILTCLLSHRKGPYGYPVFKQLRASESPTVRYQKKNNVTTILVKGKASKVLRGFQTYEEDSIVAYREAPITSKHGNLQYKLVTRNRINGKETLSNVTLKIPYGNSLVYFANKELNDQIVTYDKNIENLTYSKVLKMIKDPNSAIKEVNELRYSEVIFPREVNMFLSGTRGRADFEETAAERDGI